MNQVTGTAAEWDGALRYKSHSMPALLPARGGLPAWEETLHEASPVPQLRTPLPQQLLTLLAPCHCQR